MEQQQKPALKLYKGGCHCKAVRFEVEAEDEVNVWVCNCSVCMMRKNFYFIVPGNQMKSIQGEDNLTTYTFGTHIAKYKFCKICGITPFYVPSGNPNDYAITHDCLDLQKRPGKVHMKIYDGRNQEKSHEEKSHEETGINSQTQN